MALKPFQKNKFIDEDLREEEAIELAEQLKAQIREGGPKQNKKEAINRMITGLSDNRGLVRRAFAEGLGVVGKDALPNLIKVLLHSKNVIARRAAAKTLKLVGDPKALPHLLKALLNDPDPVVQGSSAGAMAIFGKEAIDYLLKVLTDPKTSAMQSGLASWALIFASADALESLQKAATSKNVLIRSTAIRALGENTEFLKDDEIRHLLINSLEDTSSEVRAEAVRVIKNLGDKLLVEDLLMKKLSDDNSSVRKSAALSLMKINSQTSIKLLKEMAASEKDLSVLTVINLAIKKILN